MVRSVRRGLRAPRRLLALAEVRLFGSVMGVDTHEPVVALTFDDGPHPHTTPALLALLERHGAEATFFMVGSQAARHPDLVRRVAEAGHCVANHSYDHPSMPTLAGRARRAQLRRCAEALAPYGARLFRPPFGHQSRGSRLDARRLGYQVVGWSDHCSDWLDHDADSLTERLLEVIEPGAIILLHEALHVSETARFEAREPLLTALATVLGRLDGVYSFVTVPDLLSRGHVRRRLWYRRGDKAQLEGLRPGGHRAEPSAADPQAGDLRKR